jgi:hypothetical protein
MSVPDNKASYFSRFTMKLIEIVAAGVATAVSGYMVAHLGGYWSAPAPAAVQVAPSMSAVSKSPRIQPALPVSADAGEQRPAPAPEVTSSTPPAARTTVNAGPAAAARKHAAPDATAAEAKPRDKDDKESIEARVRAALANADANRSPPPGVVQPRPADGVASTGAIAAAPRAADVTPQPRPADGIAGTGAVAAAPRAADGTPQPQPQPQQQPPQQPPPQAPAAQADPLATVEIKSRPIADVAAVPAQASVQENVPEEKGLFSVFKRIPDLLRGDAPAPPAPPVPAPTAAAAPRPPLPVGE